MSREQVYEDIKATLGLVPPSFRLLSDSTLDLEWQLFKRLHVEEGVIPGKYRELIGLGVAAATQSRYCLLFHTEAARLHGATDEEIEEAVHFAKSSVSWSTYASGMQIDYDGFKEDVGNICDYVRSLQGLKEAVRV